MSDTRQRAYVLFMLLLVYLVSLIDRQILAVLIEPIRKELRFSDTQMGLLSGLAFGLLYATMAVPLSRLGDRWSRKGMIAICLAVWSVATSACGLAQNFVQLFMARVLVGTGEAGAGPSSHSLISDYFPPEQRATALGIYSMGIFTGAGLGLFIGSIFLAHFGWRGAFIAAGLPGLVLTAIFALTVREPEHGTADMPARPPVPPFAASFLTILRSGTIIAGAFGLGFAVFALQSLLNWLPALMVRQYGFTAAEAGRTLGPLVAVAGTLGVLSGGLLCDRVSRANRANSPRLMALTTLLLVPIGVSGLLSNNAHVMLGAITILIFLNAFVSGPSFALFQNAAPPRLRAFAAAVAGLVAVILGNAIGPFAGGALSDVFAALGADNPLKWSLVSCIAIASLGSVAYLIAALCLQRTGAAIGTTTYPI